LQLGKTKKIRQVYVDKEVKVPLLGGVALNGVVANVLGEGRQRVGVEDGVGVEGFLLAVATVSRVLDLLVVELL
jgi:hypothetical protein